MSFIARTIGKLTGRQDQADAAVEAGKTQSAAAQAGIDQINSHLADATAEQQKQLAAYQGLMQPYVTAGTGALTGMQDLLGTNGGGAQSAAIAALKDSPQYQALTQAGTDAILSNASATGGLRGGNVQAALGQFQPAMLSQLIDQQFARLGGVTAMGQNSALNLGNAGLNTGNQIASNGLNSATLIANLLGQKGAATAGGQLAQGSVASQGFGDALKVAALVMGSGGFPSGAPEGAATTARTDLSTGGQVNLPGLGSSLYKTSTPSSIANYLPQTTAPTIELPFLSKF